MARPVDERLPLPQTDAFSRALAGAVPSVGLLAALTLALYPFRDDLNTGTIALVLLLPVLVSTVGGVWVALGIAALGALTFNFFFTVPYHSFRIESSESVAAFIAYVVVASIVAVASSRQRDATYLAGRRARDAQFLLAVSADIAGSTDPAPHILSALRGLRAMARLRAVHLVAGRTGLGRVDEGFGEDTQARAAAEQALAAAARDGDTSTTGPLRLAGGPVTLVIWCAGEPIGAVAADPGERALGDDELRLLESFVGLLALALRPEPVPGASHPGFESDS